MKDCRAAHLHVLSDLLSNRVILGNNLYYGRCFVVTIRKLGVLFLRLTMMTAIPLSAAGGVYKRINMLLFVWLAADGCRPQPRLVLVPIRWTVHVCDFIALHFFCF